MKYKYKWSYDLRGQWIEWLEGSDLEPMKETATKYYQANDFRQIIKDNETGDIVFDSDDLKNSKPKPKPRKCKDCHGPLEFAKGSVCRPCLKTKALAKYKPQEKVFKKGDVAMVNIKGFHY